jgi:hypothetical protein
MNLAETLQQKLSEWRPAGKDRPSTIVELPEYGWSVRFAATKVDTLGSALAEIEAVRATAIADDATALEAHARKVAGRVTGLLEPLRLIEVDRNRNIAILRSDAPRTRGSDVLFYEVCFTGLNRVSVRRFTATKLSPAHREPVEYVLTHEVVGKLVDDLVRD